MIISSAFALFLTSFCKAISKICKLVHHRSVLPKHSGHRERFHVEGFSSYVFYAVGVNPLIDELDEWIKKLDSKLVS